MLSNHNTINTLNTYHYFHCFWPKCQYKTSYKFDLYKHQLIHTNSKRFKCDFNNCNKVYKTHSDLNQHKQRVHLNVRYVCDWSECGKQFTTKSYLLRHKTTVHLNEKKFKCNEENCGKSFATKQRLIRHKRIHSGEKSFVCHFNDCGKSYTQMAIQSECCVRAMRKHLDQGLFVYEIRIETRAHPFRVSHVIAEFLDVVPLFVKELTLNEVRELRTVSPTVDRLEVQKRLIDGPLQL
ncbi:unnamed protein product [Oppiella nova]|uniref:C2H2-type domain-containing protein n=1 Tax=Oppiella nova TaxID=334625 RepID=A0A7R9LZQ6_9ACAR|nr:unnamed protein product [Oppiella nova]CAG2168478.1 unnamed protein product [Oppiella nova]